jgi:hypothetical protein
MLEMNNGCLAIQPSCCAEMVTENIYSKNKIVDNDLDIRSFIQTITQNDFLAQGHMVLK